MMSAASGARDVDPAWLIAHFGMTSLPIEGTYLVNTYRSDARTPQGWHAGTGVIGLFCDEPASRSLLHRVAHDELWHFYAGDPLRLLLLHDDGSVEEAVLGPDLRAGHLVQKLVPAGTWQAGELVPGGRWALFGCTLAPGFSGELFESGYADELLPHYPDHAHDIRRLAVPHDLDRHLPHGFL